MLKPFLLFIGFSAAVAQAEPLALHPDNPHYFVFNGRPAVLITSAEHYGAVLNLDFDYARYLAALAADSLNLTRTFSGAYVEPQGAFHIAQNTLAPKPGRFICPWRRSDQRGYANGGNRFDLTKWDDAYFSRLKDFVALAGTRGVIVEITLFCPMYEEMQWNLSPMNAANNINGLGAVGRNDVHTLNKNGGLLEVQERLVRKTVAELKDAGNLIYEICNEPYFGGVTMEWQHRIAEVIIEAEKDFPQKHLISQNVANGSKVIEKPHRGISIFNFHYAHPPDAVAQNYALNKPIGDNETGFKGTADDHYRMEAWEFLLAGGALYNNLDYSFTAGSEDRTFTYPPTQPGGGNPSFRKQMKVLSQFINSFDFVRMRPAPAAIREALPKGARCQVLAEPGKQYAIYFKGAPGLEWQLELAAGKYRVEWVDVVTGMVLLGRDLEHSGGAATFDNPATSSEIAVRMVRVAD